MISIVDIVNAMLSFVFMIEWKDEVIRLSER